MWVLVKRGFLYEDKKQNNPKGVLTGLWFFGEMAALDLSALLKQANQLFEAGQFQQAQALCEQVLSNAPQHVEGLHLMGKLAYKMKNLQKAQHYLEQAVALSPNNFILRNNLGFMLKQQGKLEEASLQYQKAIDLKPDYADPYSNLGNIYRDGQQYDKAIACYQKAIAINPNHAGAYNNLGYALHLQMRLEEAKACFEKSLELNPADAKTYNNLANVYRSLGQNDAAIAYYQKSLELDPNYAMAYNNWASILHAQEQVEEAIALYRKSISLDSHYVDVYLNLGQVLLEQGHFEESYQCFTKALELQPENTLLKLHRDTLCPVMMTSSQQIHKDRQRVEKALSAFEGQHFDIPLAKLPLSNCEPSFFMPYHGFNELDYRCRYAQVIEHNIAPLRKTLLEAYPRKASSGKKPHLGFLVTRNHAGVFLKLMGGVIRNLSREKFNVTVICHQHDALQVSAGLDMNHTGLVVMRDNFEQVLRELYSQQFDVLYFFEVGTDATNYFLPFFQVASVQCTSWGLPVTSGIPHLQYFLSSTLVEPENAQAHYRETLVQFATLPCYFYRPQLPENPKTRKNFDLPEDKTLYLCPQSVFKFHPDFDEALASILRRDPNGLIVLIEDKHGYRNQVLKERFEKTFADVCERLVFYPRQSSEYFYNLIDVCDVMLDTFHFGGGMTTYEALAFGLPIVTWPSAYMRGRVTLGCYQKMGVLDCVAGSFEEYVEIALRLGRDAQYRAEVRDRILAKNGVLYEDKQAVEAFERFFEEVTQVSQANQQCEQLRQHLQAGNFEEAQKTGLLLLAQYPDNFDILKLLGVVYYRQKQYQQAGEYFEKACNIYPNNPELFNDLGVVLKKQGRLDDAIAQYQRALELKPDYVGAYSNLGNVYREKKWFDKAQACYEKALVLDPSRAEVYNNCGVMYRDQESLDKAAKAYEKALELKPDYADAWYNLGNVLQTQNHLEKAIHAYQQALKFNPQHSEAWCNLGTVYQEQANYPEAIDAYQKSVDVDPGYADAWQNLGNLFHELGRYQESLACLEKVCNLKPSDDALCLRVSTLPPVIFQSKEDISEFRTKLMHTLESFQKSKNPWGLSRLIKGNCQPSFYLSYHGLDDLPVKETYAKIFRHHLQPDIERLSQSDDAGPKGDKIHVGFVVTARHEKAFNKVLSGIIPHLSPDLFKVSIFCSPSGLPLIQNNLAHVQGVFYVTFPDAIEGCISVIQAQNPDILYYFEVGSDPRNYVLPFFKLAPVQCTSWGLPVTSGLTEVNYYISSRLWEPQGAQCHYSETLVLEDTLPVFYREPQVAEPLKGKTLADFNLPLETPLYCCLQNLYKLHPDFDGILAAILRSDPKGKLILFQSPYPAQNQQLCERLSRQIPHLEERLLFLPRISRSEYLALISLPELVFLDSIYYDGGITSYDCLGVGATVVTLPGNFMRGRKTWGCYQKMAVLDCVASSPEHYTELAVSLAQDTSLRQAVQEKIRQHNAVLYEDMEVVRGLERFFLNAVQNKVDCPDKECSHA